MLDSLLSLLEKRVRLYPAVYWHVRNFVIFSKLFLPHEKDFWGLMTLKHLMLHDSSRQFVDIGANYGSSINSIRYVGYDGIIVSFEPAEKPFNYLVKMALNDSKLKIYNYGISNKNESRFLFTPKVRGKLLDAYATTENENLATRIMSDMKITRDQIIFIKNLINFKTLEELELNPWCIKIDTEGSENDIILDNVELIKKKRPIILTEINLNDTFLKMSKKMKDLDYYCYQFNKSDRKFVKFNEKKLISPNCFFVPFEISKF
jgi:FkbM family methyltransferase